MFPIELHYAVISDGDYFQTVDYVLLIAMGYYAAATDTACYICYGPLK